MYTSYTVMVDGHILKHDKFCLSQVYTFILFCEELQEELVNS